MKIVFLEETKADLRWFKRYYTKRFPEGQENATRQYRAFLLLIKERPNIGHPAEDGAGVREYPIPNTPFTVLHRVRGENIEIMRIYEASRFMVASIIGVKIIKRRI